MKPEELLQRIAQKLKREIAPFIGDEYAKTQAFMASVVLQKVSRQLSSATEDAAAETADLNVLLADLQTLLEHEEVPARMVAAIETLARTRENAALCSLIEALYSARAALGETRFAAMLGRIRRTLRRSLDRRVEVAE